MSETGNFRSKVFGGFDRQDVSDYISSLARERNVLKKEVERLTRENEKLRQFADAAKETAATEKKRADDFVINARAEAEKSLSELCEVYDDVRSELEKTTETVCGKMVKMAEKLDGLTSDFGKAGKRFGELRDIVRGGGDTLPEDGDE